MSEMRREDAEAIMAEVVVGERALDDPEVVAALRCFPDLGEGLAGLQALDHRMAMLGARARGGVVRAPALGPTQSERAAMLRREVAPRRLGPRWLLLAALVLGGVSLAVWQPWRGTRAPQMLGSLPPGELRADVVGDDLQFAWNFTLPDGADYVLRIYVGAGTKPVFVRNTGRQPTWRMKRSELEASAKGATGPWIWDVRAVGPGVVDGLGLGPARVPR